jgi:DNA-binding response OmpR family regulator
MNGKILIIEGKKDISRILKFNLRHEGYSISTALDGESGLASFGKNPPDFVILDITLLRKSGLEVCKSIREISQVPILLLGEKKREGDCVLGLELGADDYMAKPFNIRELQARIHAIMRRIQDSLKKSVESGSSASKVSIGGVSINFESFEAAVSGTPVALTAREFDLLGVLIRATERVFSREQLLDLVWGAEKGAELDVRTVDQHIARLRRKLDGEGARIITVKSRGYRFKAD